MTDRGDERTTADGLEGVEVTIADDGIPDAEVTIGTGYGEGPASSTTGVSDEAAGGQDVPWLSPVERFDVAVSRVRTMWAEEPGRLVEAAVSVVTVVLGTALVLATLHPSRLWSTTTPTGGDMGSHVWGPRYLMDHLLPNLRLSGWTPDWYDGFPAYQFYMVVPSLLIVALTVGIPGPSWLVLPLVLGVVLAVVARCYTKPAWYQRRKVIIPAAVAIGIVAMPMPYERSFKLVTALGLLGIPIACWAFGKLADLPFPIPPLLSVAGLIFIYNREPRYLDHGNIIGGNFQSTMAGEFAFSVSLTLAILYLGVAARGLRTGRYRALSAGLFALAGLCHLIPAFFVLACTLALVLVHPDKARLKWLATMVPVAGLVTAFWVLPFWWRRHYVNDMGWEVLPEPFANLAEGAWLAGDQQSVIYYLFPPGLQYLMWAAGLGVVVSVIRRYAVGMVLGLAWAAAMVAFWLMPQYRLWNARILPFLYLTVALLAAIAVGELIRLAGAAASGRADRPLRAIVVPGAVMALLGTFIYVALPLDGVITDFTIGPLSADSLVYLLAAVGVGVGSYLWLGSRVDNSEDGSGPQPWLPGMVGVGAFVVLGVVLMLIGPLAGPLGDKQIGPWTRTVISRTATEVTRPVQNPPAGQPSTKTETVTRASFAIFSTIASNPVSGWADWNYKGLELKTASPAGCDAAGSTTPCTTGGWPEYRGLMQTMADLGADDAHGCGRALWEYSKDRLNGYGTSMALMMLPYWTDGCIGSQEGLYFESSATVPYHFVMQVELSKQGSGAQRAMDYSPFDMAAGVRHMQLLGVKYYLATTPEAITAADGNPDLDPVASSGAWRIYQVANAAVVEPLRYEPVVAEGVGEGQHDWLPNAVAWFQRSDLEVPMAIGGPQEWARVKASPVQEEDRLVVRWVRGQIGYSGTIDQVPELPKKALPEIEVTDLDVGRDSISFDVSKTGVPVLVKASYFPNWDVKGAEGPFRVTPNLMVVVPTSEHVSLTYTRTPIDVFAILLTLLGLAGLVWLARSKPIEVEPVTPGRASQWLDGIVAIKPRTFANAEAVSPDPPGEEGADPEELATGPDEALSAPPGSA